MSRVLQFDAEAGTSVAIDLKQVAAIRTSPNKPLAALVLHSGHHFTVECEDPPSLITRWIKTLTGAIKASAEPSP